MFCACHEHLVMHEGDYGVPLPLKVKGVGIDGDYTLVFVAAKGALPMVRKEYPCHGPADELVFPLALTASESAELPAGSYTWSILVEVGGEVQKTVKQGSLDVLGR